MRAPYTIVSVKLYKKCVYKSKPSPSYFIKNVHKTTLFKKIKFMVISVFIIIYLLKLNYFVLVFNIWLMLTPMLCVCDFSKSHVLQYAEKYMSC